MHKCKNAGFECPYLPEPRLFFQSSAFKQCLQRHVLSASRETQSGWKTETFYSYNKSMLRKMLLIVLLCIYFYHKIAFSVLDRPADLQLRSGIHGAALQPDGVWALLPERGHLQCHCWQPALLCLPARVHRGQVPVLWVISTNCSIWVPRKSSTRAKFKARVGDF